jgi:hypothetical protein
MSKRTYIVGAIVILLIISQLILVRLVYAHKLSPNFSYHISKIYSLKAGTVSQNDVDLKIDLDHFFEHYLSLQHYVAQLEQTEIDLDTVAWERSVRDAWVDYFSKNYELVVTEEELAEYMQDVILQEAGDDFSKFSEETYGLSVKKFKSLILKPYLTEAKIYQYLLENYNDQEGIRLAQSAYEALENGEDFIEVAKQFSTDASYAENSIWLAESDLVDFYTQIKTLNPGEFGKIIIIPGAYVIWQLDSIVADDVTGENAWQVRSIIIQAKSFEEFFAEYLDAADINRKY